MFRPDRIRLYQPEFRMLFEIGLDAIGARNGQRQKVERLLQAVVRLGATEAQKTRARLAEAFAPQAGDAELVVGPFEQDTAPGRDW